MKNVGERCEGGQRKGKGKGEENRSLGGAPRESRPE